MGCGSFGDVSSRLSLHSPQRASAEPLKKREPETQPPSKDQKRLRWLLFIAFFLSGSCALALELVWTRMLTFVFGGTALAITTILTTYMAGLAWGSWWGGQIADRLRDPARWYALLEAGIGIWGICVPLLLVPFPWLHQVFATGLPPFGLAFFRFLLAFVILLVPTWMMGATLPILSRAVTLEWENLSQEVGRLYAINTAGAVAGCVGTGFVLLPYLGLQGSVYLVAGTNICVGALVWLGTRGLPPLPTPPPPPEEETLLLEWSTEEWLRQHLAMVIFGITGGLAMLCQTAWSRVLAVVIGSSLYAFTIVLATFLLGLALGAAFATWWLSRHAQKQPRHLVPLCLLSIALCVGLGIRWMDQLPLLFASLLRSVPLQAQVLFVIKGLVAASVVFLPTCLMGMLLPLLLSAHTHRDPIGRTVGTMLAANTVGAIVGSFAAGFLLIPWLGSQLTLTCCVLGYSALVLLFWAAQREKGWLQRAFVGLSFCGMLLPWVMLPTWNVYTLHMGLFRISHLKRLKVLQPPKRSPVIYHREGLSATVTVERHGRHVGLKINGKTDASTGLDMPTQVLAGLLPFAFHQKTNEALIIGWGSGVTVGAALQSKVRSVLAVELEPAVVEGARAFAEWNHTPQDDPRLKLRWDDGRNVLAATTRHFDVIISEPSNPWISGVSSLFTKEFFALAKARLAPKGVFCQWVQLYELSPRNIRSLIAAVVHTFPYVYLLSPSHQSRDSLLLAAHQPLLQGQTLSMLQKRVFGQQRLRKEFLRAGILSAIDLLPRLLAGPDTLKTFAKDATPNTDDNGLVELTAPLELLTHYKTNGKAWLLSQCQITSKRANALLRVSADVQADPAFQADLALATLRYGDRKRALRLLAQAKQTHPEAQRVQRVQAIFKGLLEGPKALRRCLQKERRTLDKAAPHISTACWPQLGLPKLSYKTRLLWLARPASDPQRRLLLGYIAFLYKRSNAGLKLLVPLSQQQGFLRRYPGASFLLSQLYLDKGVWPEAVWFQELYQTHHPEATQTR